MTPRTIYLRPSKAHTWRRCAGYAALMTRVKAPLEDVGNDVREDGTATHWLAEQAWNSDAASMGLGWDLGHVGMLAPNGREITEELQRGAEQYLDVISAWGAWSFTHIESGLPTGSFFPGTQDGTPDAYHVDPASPVGYLGDLKMGFKIVEVWRNDQLVIYGWTIFCLFPHLTELVCVIVQPRAAHHDGTVRTWRVTREEMRVLAEELQAAAVNAHAPNPLCTVSPACENCSAAHACKSLHAAAGRGIETAYDSTPHELSPAELGYELSKLQQAATHIEHRITGLSAQAESLIRRGQKIPGFSLQRKETRNRWPEDNVPKVEQLARLLGVDAHVTKLRTPAQLRGTFPGIDIEAMFAERPTGELALKATDPNEAIKAFTHRK